MAYTKDELLGAVDALSTHITDGDIYAALWTLNTIDRELSSNETLLQFGFKIVYEADRFSRRLVKIEEGE